MAYLLQKRKEEKLLYEKKNLERKLLIALPMFEKAKKSLGIWSWKHILEEYWKYGLEDHLPRWAPIVITFFGLLRWFIFYISHSIAASKLWPSCFIAHTGKIAQFLFREDNPNFSLRVWILMVAMSLLLAKTSRTESCMSSWLMMRSNSLAANYILSWSELSTT